MYRVSGPAFLHIPKTQVLILAVMDFADNVLMTRSTDVRERVTKQLLKPCRMYHLIELACKHRSLGTVGPLRSR